MHPGLIRPGVDRVDRVRTSDTGLIGQRVDNPRRTPLGHGGLGPREPYQPATLSTRRRLPPGSYFRTIINPRICYQPDDLTQWYLPAGCVGMVENRALLSGICRRSDSSTKGRCSHIANTHIMFPPPGCTHSFRHLPCTNEKERSPNSLAGAVPDNRIAHWPPQPRKQ